MTLWVRIISGTPCPPRWPCCYVACDLLFIFHVVNTVPSKVYFMPCLHSTPLKHATLSPSLYSSTKSPTQGDAVATIYVL